jgi:hypothetical protein
MSQVTNLAFFRARRGSSRSSRAHPARSRMPQLRYSSRGADVFILYFPNKMRRICSGSSSYNIGPLLGREGVAQNIPSGRDDFSNLLYCGECSSRFSKRQPATALVGIRRAVN